jgi:prefoldin subunit 1
MISTTQQLKIADVQMEQLKRQITHTKLVEKEVEALPKDVRTYEGVGRM